MKPILEAFWTVEYADGTYVSQFDIEPPFREHSYSEVNHKRAVRYWWLPVPQFMTIPGVRHNPLLGRHCVETRGAQGYLSRRVQVRLEVGKRTETPVEKLARLLTRPPVSIGCYIVGIEGGERMELYPDGTVLRLKEPRSNGETQVGLR